MTTQQRLILFIVSSSIFFEALDIAIVNLAMPLIQAEFGLAEDQVQWVQALYILFYGGFLIIGGKLADITGRKKIFMVGSGIFLLTSFGAGLATSFEMLVALRALQGLGAALVIPSAFSIITNTFVEPAIRNKAIGVFGSFAAIGSGSGLSIGGLIATYLGWQWIFFINVPVIGIALILAYYYIPKDESAHTRSRPDFVSGVILTLSILTITYVIHEIKLLTAHLEILALLLAMVILFGFVFMKRSRRSNPLIEFSLFKRRAPVVGYSTMVLLGGFFSGYLFLLSMIFQSEMQFTAAKAGLILLPFSVLSALLSRYVLPPVMKRITIWQGSILGMSLMFAGGLALLTALSFEHNFILILVSIACVTGTGIAVCFMALNVLIIRDIPEQDHGLAGSIGTTSFFFGGGIGLSAIGLVIATSSTYLLPVVVLTLYAFVGLAVLLMGSPKKYVVKSESM